MKNKILAQKRIQKIDNQIHKIKSSLSNRDIQNSYQLLSELKEILDDLSSIIERED